METLKWPVDKCDCGHNLREAEVRASEKSNDASGTLTWTCFCPECGRGYNVGGRELPTPTAEVLAEMEAAPVLSYVEDLKAEAKTESEPSGIPPDKRGAALARTEENPDPEGLLDQEVATQPEETPEPGGVKAPRKGQYFCTRCASNHNETSAIGKRHTKNREA